MNSENKDTENENDNVYELLSHLKTEMNNKNSLFYSNKEEFKNNIEKLFVNTSNELCAVIQVISQPAFDMHGLQRLEYMIKMSDELKKKKITEHDASVAVGQRLVDDIVKPQLD